MVGLSLDLLQRTRAVCKTTYAAGSSQHMSALRWLGFLSIYFSGLVPSARPTFFSRKKVGKETACARNRCFTAVYHHLYPVIGFHLTIWGCDGVGLIKWVGVIRARQRERAVCKTTAGVENFVENVENPHFAPHLSTQHHYIEISMENQPQDLVCQSTNNHKRT